MTPAAWRKASNILCIRLDSLGDVLMCTPALRAIGQSQAGRTVTLLTSPAAARAAPYIPELDGVIGHAAPWMKHGAGADALRDKDLIGQLAACQFDAAVIFTSYSQSALPAALLAHLAGIPLRLAHCRENPYGLLSDWVADPEPVQQVRHEVRRQLDLVASVGCEAHCARLSFQVPASDVASVRRQLANWGITERTPFVLVHPGASAPSRRYPPERWADVIRSLRARHDWPVVLTGDRSECALVEQIRDASGAPCCILAGQLDLGQLGAAISLAGAVVCNNTGPAHIAAAVGTPLANLYAMTNPQHTPWQVHSRLLFHDVPCRFCYKSECPQGHHACLAQLPPQDVVDAVASLMAWSAVHRRPGTARPVSAPPVSRPAAAQ
jgi:lipopolysaccharide heptosyltransferase II